MVDTTPDPDLAETSSGRGHVVAHAGLVLLFLAAVAALLLLASTSTASLLEHRHWLEASLGLALVAALPLILVIDEARLPWKVLAGGVALLCVAGAATGAVRYGSIEDLLIDRVEAKYQITIDEKPTKFASALPRTWTINGHEVVCTGKDLYTDVSDPVLRCALLSEDLDRIARQDLAELLN